MCGDLPRPAGNASLLSPPRLSQPVLPTSHSSAPGGCGFLTVCSDLFQCGDVSWAFVCLITIATLHGDQGVSQWVLCCHREQCTAHHIIITAAAVCYPPPPTPFSPSSPSLPPFTPLSPSSLVMCRPHVVASCGRAGLGREGGREGEGGRGGLGRGGEG